LFLHGGYPFSFAAEFPDVDKKIEMVANIFGKDYRDNSKGRGIAKVSIYTETVHPLLGSNSTGSPIQPQQKAYEFNTTRK